MMAEPILLCAELQYIALQQVLQNSPLMVNFDMAEGKIIHQGHLMLYKAECCDLDL